MLSICSRVAFSRTAASAAEMLGTGKRETDGKEVVRSFRLRHSHDHLNDWGLSICRACFWLRSVGWFWKCLLGYRRSTREKKKKTCQIVHVLQMRTVRSEQNKKKKAAPVRTPCHTHTIPVEKRLIV